MIKVLSNGFGVTINSIFTNLACVRRNAASVSIFVFSANLKLILRYYLLAEFALQAIFVVIFVVN
jgi:hypothetical protein